MEAIGEPVIPSDIACDADTALAIADRIGYPVIVRPAFTLGGAGGGVAYGADELRTIARGGLDASPITQILVEKYIYGWKEIEFEAMRDCMRQRHRRLLDGKLSTPSASTPAIPSSWRPR